MFLIVRCRLNAVWSHTSFVETGSTMKSRQHDRKHSLSEKDFPNTTKLWDYCLQLKLFFSLTVKLSYPQGDANKLLSFPRPKRNWVTTVWILLSIVSAYNWNKKCQSTDICYCWFTKEATISLKIETEQRENGQQRENISEQNLGEVFSFTVNQSQLCLFRR